MVVLLVGKVQCLRCCIAEIVILLLLPIADVMTIEWIKFGGTNK